jgi:hypothetical protein
MKKRCNDGVRTAYCCSSGGCTWHGCHGLGFSDLFSSEPDTFIPWRLESWLSGRDPVEMILNSVLRRHESI